MRLRKLLALGSNRSGLGVPNPIQMEDKSHMTSLVYSKHLLEFLIVVEALSTSEHRACVRRIIRDGRGIKYEREDGHLDREKQGETNKGCQKLERTMIAGA